MTEKTIPRIVYGRSEIFFCNSIFFAKSKKGRRKTSPKTYSRFLIEVCTQRVLIHGKKQPLVFVELIERTF
jgi:hypothetical protein